MIFCGNNDSWRNFGEQKIIFLGIHLNKGILLCGKFNVITVQGISVVLAAFKKYCRNQLTIEGLKKYALPN